MHGHPHTHTHTHTHKCYPTDFTDPTYHLLGKKLVQVAKIFEKALEKYENLSEKGVRQKIEIMNLIFSIYLPKNPSATLAILGHKQGSLAKGTSELNS